MARNCNHYKFSKNITKRIPELYTLDNMHGPMAALLNLTIVTAAIITVRNTGWYLYPLALLVIGSRQRAMATLMHEAAHGTLAANRTLNFVLGTFFGGYPLFTTFRAYQHSHVTLHHGEFGDPERDDDYRFMLSAGVYEDTSPRRYAWNVLVSPLLLLRVPRYLWFLLTSRLLATRSRDYYLEITLLLAFWTSTLAVVAYLDAFDTLLLFWIVPFLTAYQMIGWFIELSEHAPLMENDTDLHMTRNRNSHWLEHMFTGMYGESYHLAHHLWPRVPFWNMRRLHRLLLEDESYRRQDREFGGILLSSNGAPSVVRLLLHRIAQRAGSRPQATEGSTRRNSMTGSQQGSTLL